MYAVPHPVAESCLAILQHLIRSEGALVELDHFLFLVVLLVLELMMLSFFVQNELMMYTPGTHHDHHVDVGRAE